MKRNIFCSILAVTLLAGVSVKNAEAGKCYLPDFASAVFSDPLTIDNPYLPLVPDTVFVYEPVPNDDNVVNTVTVTNLTKSITVDGKTIDCRVVIDEESVDGVLEEYTLDWYAQDDEGNVWYCGEYTESYFCDGDPCVDTSGSWEAGVEGALPGYLMLAEPRNGLCYQQESAEDAQDRAKVLRLNAKVALESGDFFKPCLKTKEWTALERGHVEQKFYYEGVGLVLIKELKEKTVRVELVSVTGP